MASIAAVQEKLKCIKPNAKNAGEKYCEVLDQILRECKVVQDLKDGIDALLNAGKTHRKGDPRKVRFLYIVVTRAGENGG